MAQVSGQPDIRFTAARWQQPEGTLTCTKCSVQLGTVWREPGKHDIGLAVRHVINFPIGYAEDADGIFAPTERTRRQVAYGRRPDRFRTLMEGDTALLKCWSCHRLHQVRRRHLISLQARSDSKAIRDWGKTLRS